MRRRVPVQNLRGSDPTLLEVQLQDLLRRPMGQLALVNIMDLIALAEAEERPRSLERSLATFVERIAGSISDLPVGPPWDELLDELETLEPHRIPHRFRAMLSAEAERTDRRPERVAALLARWAEVEPEPFTLGAQRAKVTRAEASAPAASERLPRSRKASTTRAPRAPRASTSTRSVMTEDDRERLDWIAETALERLAGVSDHGLGEQVLVAGIRHRARERYPQITPIEITTVLRNLKDRGQVRYSAGRWAAVGRW